MLVDSSAPSSHDIITSTDDDDTAGDAVPPAPSASLKLILLGDSAVGKSKLVERFLLDDYKPQQLSTNALTLFRHTHARRSGEDVTIGGWVCIYVCTYVCARPCLA